VERVEDKLGLTGYTVYRSGTQIAAMNTLLFPDQLMCQDDQFDTAKHPPNPGSIS
jgi:hypothetical protein